MLRHFTSSLFILFISTFSFSQHFNYSESWKRVERYESEDLTKDALQLVAQIEKNSISDHLVETQIKCLIYRAKYNQILEENDVLLLEKDLKQAISSTKGQQKAILNNYLAQFYWKQIQNSTYTYLNRTEADVSIDNDDFRTWTYQKVIQLIHDHFQKSLTNPESLKNPVTEFKVLISQDTIPSPLRPFLLDVLAHHAIAFYHWADETSPKAIDNYLISDTLLLSDFKTFNDLVLPKPSDFSAKYEHLILLQKLSQFHQNNFKALVDLDLTRLDYIQNQLKLESSEQIYFNTLDKTIQLLGNKNPLSDYYRYNKAIYLNKQGLSYTVQNPIHQLKKREAHKILDSIFIHTKDEYLKGITLNLLESIDETKLKITIEKYIPTKYNGKYLLEYQNINSIDVSIYKLTEEQQLDHIRNHRWDKNKEWIAALGTPQMSQIEVLKNIGDFQEHSVELPLPHLKYGYYVLSICDKDSSQFTYELFTVTDIGIVKRVNDFNNSFSIVNRRNGKAFVNTKTIIFYSEDYRHNEGNLKSDTINTDKNGNISPTKYYRYNCYLHIETKKEKVSIPYNDFYYGSQTKEDDEFKTQISLFTDRSIYRPGQTVYFKGIAYEVRENKSKILKNHTNEVILLDANNQEVSTIKVESNEFGSFTGSFVLPISGLTGSFELRTNQKGHTYQSTNIQVEEYKRPKFELSFDPIEVTYEVNETVAISGNAKAYAGSNITDAKVSYTVTRQAQYPSWCWWKGMGVESQEIAFGESTTDKDGNFKFTFKAIPDLNADLNFYPVFNYAVGVDITDINGETRSNSTTISVAYHSIEVGVYPNSVYKKNTTKNIINISTKNLNGVDVGVNSTIKVYKLLAPTTVFRTRPWNTPDYHRWSEEKFKNFFPYETYNKENDINSYQLASRELELNFNSLDQKSIELPDLDKWKTGSYKVILSCRDPKGKEITAEAYFYIEDDKDKKVSENQLFVSSTDKSAYKVGDTARIMVNSAKRNLLLKYNFESKKGLIVEKTIKIGKKKTTIEFIVKEEHVGGIGFNYSYVYQNSFYNGTIQLNVAYPSHHLKIETITFRNKMSPDTKETWSFKVSNPDSSLAQAEVLASMYDQSLDQLYGHSFNFSPWKEHYLYERYGYDQHAFDIATATSLWNSYDIWFDYINPSRTYPNLNWFGYTFQNNYRYKTMRGSGTPSPVVWDLNPTYATAADESISEKTVELSANSSGTLSNTYQWTTTNTSLLPKPNLENISVRKNLKETAFFFPQLRTNDKGEFLIEFTSPEALTRWNLMLLAHTKELNYGYQTLSSVTQKELMVSPNFPRFLREDDVITVEAKVSNLTDSIMKGYCQLFLKDLVSGKNLDSLFIDNNAQQIITIDAKGNSVVRWTLKIPQGLQGIEYKVIAKAGDFTDGEQNMLPVLSNRMLVTESLPIFIKSGQSKTFELTKLKNNKSTTLTHHQLTLEMTSNPAWYAVQALPYLMEYPYECAEQTFSRLYANKLAQHIVNSKPQIKKVFDQWASAGELISNLEKNQELKSLLIEETPWLRDAQSETEQQKRIALLFDLNQMNNSLELASQKLQKMQQSNGSWSWFEGGYPNRYITQHIISGFGHLKQLNVSLSKDDLNMVQSSMKYLNQEFEKEYQDLIKNKVDLSKNCLSSMQLHYLYLISNFPEYQSTKGATHQFYISQIEKYWKDLGLYERAMASIILHKNGKPTNSKAIINALKQNAIVSEELGMYWKSNTNSWYWNQAPIETQSIIIEAFSVCTEDIQSIDLLKQWLLKNKQTNRWSTTKATSEAVYALLLRGSDWLATENKTTVTLGSTKVIPNETQAGTGYFKTTWKGEEIKAEMAKVAVQQTGQGVSWGALYWQYFEDMNKITFAKTSLTIDKKLYKKINTNSGEQLIAIDSDTTLKVGDLVRVVTLIRTDRDMDFVHLKDMRASCFEPVDVLSGYRWKGGLGFYQSTKDAATHFFIDNLPKGQYVFEYDLRVNNAGTFSNGISSLQCMYAPEFTSHSSGLVIEVK